MSGNTVGAGGSLVFLLGEASGVELSGDPQMSTMSGSKGEVEGGWRQPSLSSLLVIDTFWPPPAIRRSEI